MTPLDFGRLVNTISTRGGQIMPPILLLAPQIFRLSDIPGQDRDEPIMGDPSQLVRSNFSQSRRALPFLDWKIPLIVVGVCNIGVLKII